MKRSAGNIAKMIFCSFALLQLLCSCTSNLRRDDATVHPILGAVVEQNRLYSEPEETQEENASFDEATVLCLSIQGENQTLCMREYLAGVLYAELPADFSLEAMKAQAVAARTVAMKKNQRNQTLCSDSSCCQAYRIPDENTPETVWHAVDETDGEVLFYQNELIEATYFSCSGGMTEAAVEVWGYNVDYLQAVVSPGEELAPRYEELLTFPMQAFCETLRTLEPEIDLSNGIKIGKLERTAGNGVRNIQICNITFTGVMLRNAFGLRSTCFTIQTTEHSVRFHCMGYGHRVGMSQYGAQAMAEQGADYRAILSHYYPGTEIKNQP